MNASFSFILNFLYSFPLWFHQHFSMLATKLSKPVISNSICHTLYYSDVIGQVDYILLPNYYKWYFNKLCVICNDMELTARSGITETKAIPLRLLIHTLWTPVVFATNCAPFSYLVPWFSFECGLDSRAIKVCLVICWPKSR